jgi:hypothetical protein
MLVGHHKPGKWSALEKVSGKVTLMPPVSIRLDLSEEGMLTYFHFNYPTGFTHKTYKKFFSFLLKHLPAVNGLLHRAQLSYIFEYIDSLEIEEDLTAMLQNEDYYILFESKVYPYPISSAQIEELILSQLLIFPLFHCFSKIYFEERPNLKAYTNKINDRLKEYMNRYEIEPKTAVVGSPDMVSLLEKASLKIKVPPGIRWQVFARDNWKCVS